MKIITDKTHKSFNPNKKMQEAKFKKIAQKVGIFATTIGIVATLSGCHSAKNTDKMSEYFNKKNEAIISMYKDGTLSEQSIEEIELIYAPIDDDFISNLPSDLKVLHLYGDNFVKDLSDLPNVCPELEELTIGGCPGITNFDFLDELENLKSFNIEGETIGITDELITQLNRRGINHNLNAYLVDLDRQVSEIARSIITDDMSEDERMDAIANYVINHVKYDHKANQEQAEEYNGKGLTYALQGLGVCENYTALTSALCSKAGIVSYDVHNSNHSWNLVQIDGKYYYVDTTNICQIPWLSKLIMEKLGKGFNYMQDPYHTGFSAMSDVDEVMLSNIPENLLRLINEAEDEKGFIEKYGSNYYADLFAILGIALAIPTIKFIKERVL